MSATPRYATTNIAASAPQKPDCVGRIEACVLKEAPKSGIKWEDNSTERGTPLVRQHAIKVLLILFAGSLYGCPGDGFFSVPLPDPPLPMDGLVLDVTETKDAPDTTTLPDTSQDLGTDEGKDTGTDTSIDVQDPYCGDGECNGDETWLGCPKDCEAQEEVFECFEKECEEDYEACKDEDGCFSAALCVTECANPADCIDACLANVPDITAYFVLQLISCGQEDCLPDVGPICGDDSCQEPENYTNCPQDCEPPPPPTECVFEYCESELENCVSSNSCEDKMGCFIDCGSTPDCAGTCAETGGDAAAEVFLALVACAFDNDCLPGELEDCGDGFCGDDEDPYLCPEDCAPPWDGTCEDRCGDFNESEPCQCDFACMEYDDCCEDYMEFCGTTPVGSCEGRCGDYDADAPCQCNEACEQFGDCCSDYEDQCLDEPVDFFACVEENCGETWEECLGQEECIGGFFCMVGCDEDEACEEECLEEAGGEGQATLYALIGCAVLNGCVEEEGAVCGNDECEEGENPFNCPSDCDGPGGGAECGNDECEPGENGFNCPEDCDGPGGGPECGDGVCQGPEVFYCPEDCEEETECGNGECEPGENGFNCPADCDGPGGGPQCGDGVCQGPEIFSCEEDCGELAVCGNDECEPGENGFNCPEDCTGGGGGPECGDGICQGPENFFCPEDCEPESGCEEEDWVGDGWCDPGNNSASCDWDGGDCCETTCVSEEYPCGVEGYDCEDPEACENNPANCAEAVCGDGICQGGEITSCPEDCFQEPACGNNVCEDGEELLCPEDCSSDTEALLDCLGENCTEALADCMNDPACTAVVDCVFSCSGPAQSCVDNCVESSPGFSFPLIVLGGCAEQQGCL
ncbi:MAG: hypothetical protein CMH54_02475 [Myxococcales bacterium]|nr:hypothetical protein [Myxococcales bacterium]